MATISKGKTFTDGELVTPAKLHQLVDSAQVTGIVNADIAAGAAIADTKLATITTPDKVSPAAVTGLVSDFTTLATVVATHTHDDRYYTETEIDSKLAGLPVSGHTHSATDITSGTLANARTTATSSDVSNTIVLRDNTKSFSAQNISLRNSPTNYTSINLIPSASGGSFGYAVIQILHKTSGFPFAEFFMESTKIGSITASSNTSVAYNTSSDYRLKTNLEPLTDAVARLLQIPVHRFNWVADPNGTKVDGFLAHEAQAVVPESVTGHKDEVDAEGKPVHQGIDQSKLVPLLVAAVQELAARVEALENP